GAGMVGSGTVAGVGATLAADAGILVRMPVWYCDRSRPGHWRGIHRRCARRIAAQHAALDGRAVFSAAVWPDGLRLRRSRANDAELRTGIVCRVALAWRGAVAVDLGTRHSLGRSGRHAAPGDAGRRLR